MHRSTIVGLLSALLLLGPATSVRADPVPAPASTASAGPNAGPSAPAPPPVDDAKKAEARANFEKAVALFEEEAWDAALAGFLNSRQIYPTRAATKDAAICLRKLHRFDEALDMFEALVREFPNLPPDDKALADHEIKELQGLVGSLDIRDAEPGASIVLDSRDRGPFPPPAPIRVSAGSHVLRVYKEGFAPFETRIDVAGGQTTNVSAHLGALSQSGRLKVAEQSGKSLDVVVDNVVVGKTPWEGPLAVGEHSVQLRGEGNMGTQPASAPVALNQVTPLTLVAEPLDASLRVEPTPAGASVAIDGVMVGRGVWEGHLRAGSHRVEVAAEGFLPLARQITLEHNKQDAIVAPLDRDPNSAIWSAAHLPKFMFEIDLGPAIAPSLGGDIAGGCSSPCSKNLGLGVTGMFHGGYQFASGLGVALDAGYLTVSQKVTGRPTSIRPTGENPNFGAADDKLTLKGLRLGASGALHRGEKFPLTLRLGAGVLLGQLADTRSGSNFTTTAPSKPPTTYNVPAIAANPVPAATYVYLAPEVRVGMRFANHFEVSAGIEALILKSVKQPVWPDPQVATSTDGVGVFGAQVLAGSTIFVLVPGLGARYDF